MLWKLHKTRAAPAAGHFFLSCGADEIKEREIASAQFELGDTAYLLMDMDADAASLDTLARMALEVVEAGKE